MIPFVYIINIVTQCLSNAIICPRLWTFILYSLKGNTSLYFYALQAIALFVIQCIQLLFSLIALIWYDFI